MPSDPRDLAAEVLRHIEPNMGCLFAWERRDRQDPTTTPLALWHPAHDCSLGRGHAGPHQCKCEAVAAADAVQDPRVPPLLFRIRSKDA